MRPEDIGLDWLHARVTERDGCLVWVGSVNSKSGLPQANVGGKVWSVRRLVWELAHGRALPSSRVTVASCGCDLCVHPDHLVSQRRGEWADGIARSVAVRARIAKAKRAAAKLTPELVAEIKCGDMSARAAARLHGVHHTTADRIRSGRLWADHTSPFRGLGAR